MSTTATETYGDFWDEYVKRFPKFRPPDIADFHD